MEKPQTLDPIPATTTTIPPPSSNPLQNPNRGIEDPNPKPSNPTVAALEAAVASGAAADLEKKLRRAERFGVAVQLSEEEKRRTRAERFGTATGSLSHGTKNGGKLEEQKRKARAERFGIAVHHPTDEEAKKKARLERFGQKSKPTALEEEKMKARAARFSQSKNNGKEASATAKAVTRS